MKLTFFPMRRDDRLTLSRTDEVLTINGEDFDFGPLPEGASLPAEAIACDWIAGPVARVLGVLHVPLILPHGARASGATLFPSPLTLTANGPVDLPAYEIEKDTA